MSKAWSQVLLEKVVAHRKEFIRIDDLATYKRCRVQLHAQGIVLRDIVPGSEIKTKDQQVCRAGEFLVAEIDAKVGGFGIIPESLDGAIVSSHYFLFTVEESVLGRRFLDFFIRTPAFREQVSAQGSTNYAAIRPRDVLGYRIPLPLLPEQHRIVARIEELAAKIEEARGLRRKAVEEVASFVSSLHLSLARERIVTISDILRLDESKEEVQFGQQYPQVGVKGFGQGLFARETLDATQTTYKVFNRLYNGALVLSQVKGWEGAVAVCGPDLNQTTEDSYTSSLAVEPLPFGLSGAERKRRPPDSRPACSSTSPLARLRLERTVSVYSKSFTLSQCPVVRFSRAIRISRVSDLQMS